MIDALEKTQLAALGEELLRVQSRRAQVPGGTRLETSAFRILWRLSLGERTMRELADELGLEQSTVHRQVHAAIDAGLVERFERPGRAGRLLRPTAAGRATFDSDSDARGEAFRAALEDLGAARTVALTALLRDFNDALDQASRRR